MPQIPQPLSIEPYLPLIQSAVSQFWQTRQAQQATQKQNKQIQDTGSRSAVTGGQQLNGFLSLLKQIALDLGIPEACIYTRNNHLPGFFRPTKDWDFVIISPDKKLSVVIELKSQVGPSFGNNFNNRSEEALGCALDLWTAFREKAFPNQTAPWLGYLVIVEKAPGSTKPVGLQGTHYLPRTEFNGTSYLDRYQLLCQKLVLERHYTSAALLWTETNGSHGSLAEDVSLETFLRAYMGHLLSQLHWFAR